MEANKNSGMDWFRLESNAEGTKWFGKCWYMHELLKYEFDVEFDVSRQTIRWKSLTNVYLCFPWLQIDTCDLPHHSTRDSTARTGRKDGQNVSWR